MYKKFLPLAVSILLGVACNDNSGKEAATKPDSTSLPEHEHAAATAPAAEIPAVPDIPEGAKVYFKNLKNGATVTSPFKVEMGVDKLTVDTANGKIKPGSGHHHILIDLDSIAAGTVVPKDSTHLHFGNAQTQAEIKVPAGKHKLTLQFADGLHRSYGGRLTSTITINVKK